MSFKSKVVLVTGASGGIGAVTALEFAKAGAQVVLAARTKENLDKIAAKCKTFHGIQPLVIQADVSVDADNERIIEETVKHFNRIDTIVNNAASIIIKSFEDSSLDDFNAAINTNVRAVFHLTKLAVPHLAATRGNIVNVSSIGATVTIKGLSVYCVSKAALNALTKSLALELAPKGIRVNAVSPGPTHAQKADAIVSENYEPDGWPQHVSELMIDKISKIPLGRAAYSEDIAAMVLFLASDAARSVTGCINVVDSGASLAPSFYNWP